MNTKYESINNVIVFATQENTTHNLNELENIKHTLNKEGRNLVDLDIKKLKYGLAGEAQILFNLRTLRSHS